MNLILASNSPRRKEFFDKSGFKYKVIPSVYEEISDNQDPVERALLFSYEKAKDVFYRLNDENSIVVGADTVVFAENNILGKPEDEKSAYKMLESLSGRTHIVVSGFCIYTKNQIISDYDSTVVTFNKLSESEINSYLKSGLYKGKAGAYGIQDGYNLVKNYTGSLDNVIGLPTEKIFPVLKKLLK